MTGFIFCEVVNVIVICQKNAHSDQVHQVIMTKHAEGLVKAVYNQTRRDFGRIDGALFPIGIDDKTIAIFRKQSADETKLLGAFAWASFWAARKTIVELRRLHIPTKSDEIWVIGN